MRTRYMLSDGGHGELRFTALLLSLVKPRTHSTNTDHRILRTTCSIKQVLSQLIWVAELGPSLRSLVKFPASDRPGSTFGVPQLHIERRRATWAGTM